LRQIVSDHQPYLGTYGGSGAEFGRALEVDRIDLNGDGIVEFVVSGSPSFCGNRLCTFDVYRESRAGFESLTEGGLVKGTGNRIVLGKTRIKGYLDLVEKNGNRSVQRCRFDGRRYK
jgi:hypothetical protein